MKKMVALCLAIALLFCACGKAADEGGTTQAGETGSTMAEASNSAGSTALPVSTVTSTTAAAATVTPTTTTPVSTAATAASTTAPATTTASAPYTVTSQSLDCQRDGMRIAGTLYLPQGAAEPLPLVILSHSFSLTQDSLTTYAQTFAEWGYTAYTFDFCGGSPQSESDGDMSEMTVFTEQADLLAVLAELRALPQVDSERIFLFGTSQGGLVSALVAAERYAEIAGLVLLYPGFSIPEQVNTFAANGGSIPENLSSLFGSVGADYINSLIGFNVYSAIAPYQGAVLIFHGTADFIVPISYSRQAAEVYQKCELVEIAGASHGFNRDNFSLFQDYDPEILPKIQAFFAANG